MAYRGFSIVGKGLREVLPDGRTRLFVREISSVGLVDRGANHESQVLIYKRADEPVDKAKWTTAYINTLPDASFAVIESGGTKDDEGKTTPRSLRHLPYKDADGKVDLPHLRNALARLPQSSLSAELKARAQKKLDAAAKEAGVGDYAKARQGLATLAPALLAKMDAASATFGELAGVEQARNQFGGMVNTLCESIYGILNDAEADRPSMLQQSVAQFAAAVTAKIAEWFGTVEKVGAKMAGDRLTKFKAAMEALQEIMSEVEGMMSDTKKSTDPAALEKRATDAEAKVAELTKQVTELQAKVPKDDDVLKSLPDDIRKRVEKAEADAAAAIAKAEAEEDKRITAEFVKRAQELGVPAKPEEFGPILKRITQGKSTEADLTEIERVLKALTEQVRKGALFTEQGRSGADSTQDASGRLDAICKQQIAEGKAKNYREALASAKTQHPDLWEQARHESRVRV